MRTKKKVKGQSRGKRWIKGQSSSSNPETNKFREQARSRFFSVGGIVKGNSSLTQEAVKDLENGVMDNDDVDSVKTYATKFTNCSNVSFNCIFQNMRMDSAFHKDLLAVLAAVSDVIKDKGGKESDTEYFAALMSTIGVSDTEETLTAVFTLLALVMKKVPASVLKLKFADASKIFVQLLGSQYQGQNNLIKNILRCLTFLLIAQDKNRWTEPSTLHIFQSVLQFILHDKPRVRKCAWECVVNIMENMGSALTSISNAPNPVQCAVSEFCLQELNNATSSDSTVVALHLLGFLKQSIHLFSSRQIKGICETVLKVMCVKHPIIFSCSLQVLHCLFEANLPAGTFGEVLNAKLITALYDYCPNMNDSQQVTSWLFVMKEAHCNLFRLDPDICLVHLVNFIKKIHHFWTSEKADVRANVEEVIIDCMSVCFDQLKVECTPSIKKPFLEIFSILESCFKYQFNKAWNHVIKVVGLCYKLSEKSDCVLKMKGSFSQLANLRDIPNFPHTKAVDETVGLAIRHIGPKPVIQEISLMINGDESDNMNFPHSWLLPVLRDNVCNTELSYFADYFLPLALKCRDYAESCNSGGDIARYKVYSLICTQIWSLLPGFCKGCVDATDSFGNLAKTLGITLKQLPEVRKDILNSLRILITDHKDDAKMIKLLQRYSKNFLPILFEIFTSENEKSPLQTPLLDTIKLYLGVCEQEVFQILFKKVYDKIQQDPSCSSNLLLLLRTFISYCSLEQLQSVFDYSIGVLKDNDSRLEKFCLKIIEEICQSKSDNCRALVTAQRSALEQLVALTRTGNMVNKAPRLIILSYVIKTMEGLEEEFLQDVLPEAVICVKQANERTRAAAYTLVTDIADCYLRNSSDSRDEVLKRFVMSLFAGLAGSTSLISATILAVTHVLFKYKEVMTRDILDSLVHDISLLMTSSTREVIQSCLSFIHTLTSLPADQIDGYLPILVKSLDSMSPDSVRHFRLKIRYLLDRLLRKYGYELVLQHISHKSTILLKVIKNIRKQKQRKSKKGDDEKDPAIFKKNIVDSEEEGHEAFSGVSKRTADQDMYIEENPDDIVDLLSSTTISHLRAGSVAKKTASKAIPFQQADDGRFIIADEMENDDSDDSGEEPSINRKRKISVSAESSSKYQAGGIGIHRPIKRSKSGGEGSEYRSMKAAGDVKVKGKPDPYTYIPLDRKGLNKRKNIKLQTSFRKIVKKAQEGARKGKKMKGRRKS